MKYQFSPGKLVAMVFFVLAFSTDVRSEIISKVPGDFGWRKSVPLHLILSRRVVQDLGLSMEVAQNLKSLHEQIQREVEEARRNTNQNNVLKPDPWVRRYDWNDAILHAARNRYRVEISQLLTEQQQERLYQIHIQRQRKPTDVLCDPEVAKALSLTGAQRAEIYQRHWAVVKAEMDEVKMGSRYKGPRSSTLEQDCPETIMEILSEEQRQEFQRLQGQPLK